LLCAHALQEDWSLNRFESECAALPALTKQSINKVFSNPGDSQSHWFKIEYDGSIKPLLHCEGLPTTHDFDTLVGLGSAA